MSTDVQHALLCFAFNEAKFEVHLGKKEKEERICREERKKERISKEEREKGKERMNEEKKEEMKERRK